MRDVTKQLLSEAQDALGDLAKMARRAAPAKKIEGSLLDTWRKLIDPRSDTTIGYVSRALLYGHMFRGARVLHRDVIRLLKGNFLVVLEMDGPVPEYSAAKRDSPYSTTRWYSLAANPEKQHLFPEV